ncbi:MAG: ATP-binding protein [Cyanobacteria bacterium P01_D01_bin.115]
MTNKSTVLKIPIKPEIKYSLYRPRASVFSGFSHWSLNKKIVAGYVSAFLVSSTGIATGFFVGRNIEQTAHDIQAEAIEDVENVISLKESLLTLLVHKDETLKNFQAGDLEAGQKDLSDFRAAHDRFKRNWEDFKDSDEFNESEESDEVTEAEAEIAADLLEDYEVIVTNYIQQANILFEQTDLLGYTPEQLRSLQPKLLELNQNEFITDLNDFIDKVTELANVTADEQVEAAAVFQQASRTQLQIILASTVISGVIGVLLMILISRVLLRPLQTMTQTVQHSIQQADFDVQVPVSSHDETGILAQTFNTHLKFVNQLLAQRETTNQQLESTLEELRHTQTQIVQSEKMSGLGKIVAGIAHEINNPVNFIHGNLAYVQNYVEALLGLVKMYQEQCPITTTEIRAEAEDVDLEFIQNDLPKTLDSMKTGSDRIREIVLSLRSFSRFDEADIKLVDIHEGLDSTLMILGYLLEAEADRPEIRVHRDYAILPLVECYAGLLNQVFLNVLTNAIEALSTERTPQTLQASIDRLDQITLRTALVDEQWVQITITDNGPGISPEVQQKMFDPFFTTKSVGEGTGMGLAVSYQIVTERHGGQLTCRSSLGEGAEFIIQIPVRRTVTSEST